MNNWYRITYSGEYVVSAESEEQAIEYFNSEVLNESESIEIVNVAEIVRILKGEQTNDK